MTALLARDPALEAALAGHLNGNRFGSPLYVFQRIGSTMDEAHRLAQEGAPEGTLVVALRQKRGRGRLGRVWSSPAGGLYLSLVLRPSRSAMEIPQLSLVAGLSVAEAIHGETGVFPSIRWPNDIVLRDKKVAGILVEAKTVRPVGVGLGSSRERFRPQNPPGWMSVVLGIGINVTTRANGLPREATSLAAAGAKATDPWKLASALCRRLEAWHAVWSEHGFGPIREALRPWIGLFGQPVDVRVGFARLEGTASDLDEAGRLLVRLDSGVIRAFEVGEVTLLRPAA